MTGRRDYYAKSQVRQARGRNATAVARLKQKVQPRSRRQAAVRDIQQPFAPPEEWHEPHCDGRPYQVLVQDPGEGYRHIVTVEDVRHRLAQLPKFFLRELEIVKLARMTRKKQSFPCYGMQWGATLYLYPLEVSLVEQFHLPPSPSIVNESKMFGGRWKTPCPGVWTLEWSEAGIRDFYLNNILIHELGHLLDERNSSYTDRERFAEWFAIEFGYRPTGGNRRRRAGKSIRRRHHSC